MATCYAQASGVWASAGWEDSAGGEGNPVTPMAGDTCYSNGFDVDVNDATAWDIAANSVTTLDISFGGKFTTSYNAPIIAAQFPDVGAGNVADGTNYKWGSTANNKLGTYSPGGTYVEGQAAQYVTDAAEVTAAADHLDDTETICGVAGTRDPDLYVAKTAVVAASFVAVGNDNYTGGSAGTYPTTATSKAEQLASDQAAVDTNKAGINDDITILTVTGTQDVSALEDAAAAAQLVVDVAEAESKKGGVVVGTTILGVAGSAPSSGVIRAGRGF